MVRRKARSLDEYVTLKPWFGAVKTLLVQDGGSDKAANKMWREKVAHFLRTTQANGSLDLAEEMAAQWLTLSFANEGRL